jgi:SpoVK/Ycf46/Vps4 family AAA+-type ATPase
LSEKHPPVFIVATANDINSLPPELVRKGRFDEIFFVDLPSQSARESIFTIHLKARDLDPAGFDLVQLATASEGFSGAEIEQAVVSALYAAHAKKQALAKEHILNEIALTRPLSVVMAEPISAMRQWASGRTVPCD